MPTECERSNASSTTTKVVSSAEVKDNNSTATTTNFNEDLPQKQQTTNSMMEGGDMSTSQTSTTSNGSSSCNGGGGRKTSITSPDPTAYVAKARVTRPTPPPPPYNPMQFVQIKPCNLYQTAQEQLKKAEEVKKIKEIRKEEPEDWQNNLDNWKSSRRKRVEHIIDRVVEVKKLELEEHDRTRRKSKTFSEMIEERGERAGGRGLNKLASLAVYAEDESNDLSDLGIGTSSASGKSSLSEDYDNNSVMSDNAAELDKAITNSTHYKPTTESTTREYISSPGYETSSSTAPASSPDPCEYTYEGAIQDYKQRVSRAASGLTSVSLNKLTNSQIQQNSKESTPERSVKETAAAAAATAYPPRRGSKIEDRLMGFEVQSPSSEECVEKSKVDVPKIDISKRKEIFETQQQQQQQQTTQTAEPKSQVLGNQTTVVPRVTLRDRFKVQEINSETTLTEQPKKELKRLSGDITSIKERLQSLEQQQNLVNGANGACKTTANKLVDIPVPPLKERLSSLQNAVTKEEIRKPPVVLVDARQLEIMKVEEEKAQQSLKETKEKESMETNEPMAPEHKAITEETEEIDRDDSGIHTADDVELEEQRLQTDIMKREQELKLNAAIEALAKEEKQLSEAANAVNQIEAEFEELSLGSVALPPLATATSSSSSASASATPITNDHMEYSVSSTNPLATTTSSLYNDNSNDSKSSISENSSVSIGNGHSDSSEVKGLDFKSNTNLRRKPTNEMVHAKNLLKIFKETFQNDMDLEEHKQNEESETKVIRKENEKENLGLNIKTQIYENSNNNVTNTSTTSKESTPQSPKLSNIPRSMAPLIAKPPMSPQTIRSSTKFVYQTPPGSPALARKTDSQFSINGRVEIFNSKTMTSPIKPTTPTMTTKKTQLPYIKATAATAPESLEINSNNSNNIVLPQTEVVTTMQRQKQINTVIEPLLSMQTNAINRQTEQQQQQQQQQLKSMLPQQMVNEPQIKLDDNDDHQPHKLRHQQHHQPNHSKNVEEAVKQQQQPEVVVCAPPITIVNPDELPKPNTVKNLSNCFQQKDTNSRSAANMAKQTATPPPKPLPRSRIPQATPPQSPLLPRRHICYSSTQSSTSATSSAEEDNKKLSVISLSSTSSTSTDSTVIDNAKKLSILSNVSSTSGDVEPTTVKTNAQVHKEQETENENETEEVPKKQDDIDLKSIKWEEKQSAAVETTEIKPATSVEKELPEQDVMENSENGEETKISEKQQTSETKLAKTLDKAATQALVDEMIKAETENRSLALNTKFRAPLAPLKTNVESPNETPISTPTQSKLPSASITPTSSSSSLKSPTELFKITTPLVVSTLYDKYQPTTPQITNNQRTPALSPTEPKPIKTTSPSIIIPAELPNLPDCSPNESTLYKLATSGPHSPSSSESNTAEKILTNSNPNTPSSPSTNSEKNLAIDSAICNSLLASLAATPDVLQLQRQHTVEEDLCQKVDKDTLPFHIGATGYKDISKTDIRKCDGLTPSSVPKLHGSTQRQRTVEEELCQKIDVHSLPDGKQQPITGFKSVSPTEILKCDNFFGLGAGKPSSKPNSPIMEARAAHSKALIETCEKIIAEEKQANSQLKSSLPSSPVGSPIIQRKSKIPKPITSCCKVTESLNEADLKEEQNKPQTPPTPKDENNAVIARMHVVETQIKVTTTTPPASPESVATKTQASPLPHKKTKNIFDFLKKNFGVGGGHSPKEGQQELKEPAATATGESSKVLVLTEKELQDLEKVKYDEIHKFDNSKFYLPSSDIVDDEITSTPPPLPKTPAPVNIEITRKIITDEIVEDGKTENDLTKEIDDLLDDELNKLNHEIEELEKVGQGQK